MTLKRAPRWAKWRLMPEIEIWEAVSLSLGIEPTEVRCDKMAWMGAVHPFAESEEFSDRLDVLRANRASKEHFPTASTVNTASWFKSIVKLSDFARFAVFAGWSVPEELQRLALPDTSRSSSQATKSQDHAKAQSWCELKVKGEGPLRFGDLAKLIAEAQHPDEDEFACAIARINLDSELDTAVRDGRLIVRNAFGLGRHTFPIGDALQNAVVLQRDLSQFLADKAMTLRVVVTDDEKSHSENRVTQNAASDADVCEPLSTSIAKFLGDSFDTLPPALRGRIEAGFSPHWDYLSPESRLNLARQLDIQHNPALEEVNQWWFNHWCEVERVKQQIVGWERMSDHGTPSEAIIKERKLDELRLALSQLEHEADATADSTNKDEEPLSLPQRGLNKEQVITAFGDLVGTNLSKALADGAKWVLPARLAKGTPGRRHLSMWDPVVLAVALQYDKGASLHKLKQVFQTHDFLSPWRERWEEIASQ